MGSTAVVLSTTQQTNIDKRQAVAEGGIGISADASTINVQYTDLGAIARALGFASETGARQQQALQSVLDYAGRADATLGEGFNSLLAVTDKLVSGAFEAVAASSKEQAGAFQAAQDRISAAFEVARGGGIDNRTIVVLGVAGLVAVAVIWGPKLKAPKLN